LEDRSKGFEFDREVAGRALLLEGAEIVANLFYVISILKQGVHQCPKLEPGENGWVGRIGTVEGVGSCDGTSTKLKNNNGDFVFVIVEKHQWFVVKVKLAVIQERCVFGYFTVELGG